MKAHLKRMKHKSHIRNKQAYWFAAVFLVLLGSLISIICFTYYGWLQSTIQAESSSYLAELSKKAGITVENTVDNYFGILDTTENLFQNIEMDSVLIMQEKVENQRKSWDFRDLLLINEKGEVFDESGNTVSLPQDDFLRETIVNRKRVISPAQLIDGAECILFTIPVENITVKDTPIRALGITYLLDSFDEILSTAMFDGEAYTNVINLDGTIAIPSASESAVSFGYNMIYYLEKEAPEQKDEIAQMKSNVIHGIAGQVECNFGGKDNYITYYPLNSLNWCLMTVVPVAVANAKTQSLLIITLWFCAFIIAIVTYLVLMLAIGFFKNKRNLEKLAFVDPITGGYTLQKFSIITEVLLRQAEPDTYALIYTNLEKFRIFNEQHGRNVGNLLLQNIYQLIQNGLSEKECICRIVDDHFCILMKFKDTKEVAERFELWFQETTVLMEKQGVDNPALQFGVYVINNPMLEFEFMIDRARFALNKIEKIKTGYLQYAIYDDEVHLKEVREKELEGRMEKALENGEFKVYLQPKYYVEEKRIGGAEALIRWKSADGMIFPDGFIPLFEKNGFIIQIDLFVFEEACKTLQRWRCEGKNLLPVSVNCSRKHLENKDFLDTYKSIFEKYDIPAKYLELEITERILYEDTEFLVSIVNQIHEIGFQCSIDDFGSGYSSLNLIKDIPADILKIDKIFFQTINSNHDRVESVVKAIINMAKSLSMTTVAEGVEYPLQVEMLQGMGCDLVQGYVFAKPMPISEFEELAFSQQPRD